MSDEPELNPEAPPLSASAATAELLRAIADTCESSGLVLHEARAYGDGTPGWHTVTISLLRPTKL
jgi:hypothetical protein